MSGKVVSKRFKWSMDFNLKQKQLAEVFPDPPGYSITVTPDQGPRENKPDLIEKKLWDIALGPLKQIPMNLLFMWMAGNSISIFPIMMVGMMFLRPIQALLAIQQTFRMIEGKSSHIQKLVFIFSNIVSIGLAVYKCNSMGLLPLHASDWLAFVQPQERAEWSGGGFSLS